MLGALPRAIILDTKAEAAWITFARRYGYEIRNGEAAALAALRSPEPPPRILARCFDPLGSSAAELCELIFERRRAVGTCVVDEAGHWCKGRYTNRGLRLVWTMGGGLGLGGYVGAQRPVDVWNGFFSEADHYVVFRLDLEDDRETMEEKGVPGVIEQGRRLDRFWWLYHSADDFGPAALMRPIPL